MSAALRGLVALSVGIELACSAPDVAVDEPNADAAVDNRAGGSGGGSGGSGGAPSAGGGAGGEDLRSRQSLVDHQRWTLVPAPDDPFDDRPEPVLCAENAYFYRELAGEPTFEIETVRCNYLTVVQPTLVDVRPGDRLVARVWRFELTTLEAAEAHIAVMLGGEVGWEARVPIPSGSELMEAEWRAAAAIAAGTPVYFHLHNHGANSWSFIELSAGP